MTTNDPDRELKLGDIVYERTRKDIKVGRYKYKTAKELNIKQKRGVIVSERYLAKPNKAGKEPPMFKVQWDGRSVPDPVLQGRIRLALEGEE